METGNGKYKGEGGEVVAAATGTSFNAV